MTDSLSTFNGGGGQEVDVSVFEDLKITSPSDSLSLKDRPQALTVFGYYRLFLYGREMTEPYPNLSPFERTYGVGDGYREPMLSLNALARPNGRTSFGTEMYFFSNYQGLGPEDNTFTLNLGINFYGGFRTSVGNFGIRAGGIHWYSLSPFTIGVYQILDRYSIFDRTPWEGVSNISKYDNYFNTGAVNTGDLRWNNQAFQGIILDAQRLPGNFSFDIFYGKTGPNAGLLNAQTDPYATIQNPNIAGNVPGYQGFAGNRSNIPSFLTGGKIRNTFGKKQNELGYNVIYSETALDSLGKENWNYQVHSLSLKLNIADVMVSGELGIGSLVSPEVERNWGEALMLRFLIPEKYTYLPLDIQLYQISKDFFNQNGEIITGSNPDFQRSTATNLNVVQLNTGSSFMTQVNQLIHNRRGVNLNTGVAFGPAKFNLGWGISEELEAINSNITYAHRVNGLALSRVYNPFPAGATSPTVFGPYGRKTSSFRLAFETVKVTDLDPATAEPLNKRFYSAVDLQGKLKLSVFDKPLYFFYLGSLGSSESQTSIWPTLREETYLFVQYHEFDLYFEIIPKFILTGYYGLERVQGGRFTEYGETNLPRDQIGRAIGMGFDWTLSSFSGLYFRYRRMNFEDKSFELDRFKGNEITIELKTFF